MRLNRLEASVPLLLDGYDFSHRLRERLPPGQDPDIVWMRLLGHPACLLRGTEAVRLFTDTTAVQRNGATPAVVATTLFGRGAVHGLDDEAHQHRKALFVQATRAHAVAELVDEVNTQWRRQARHWTHGDVVTVEQEAVHVVGRAVLAWAGIRVPDDEADRVAGWLAAVVDGFGVVGPARVRASRARWRSDRWASALVQAARAGDPGVPDGSVLHSVASWTEPDGSLLPVHTAAVELLNVLRPTVAVARFVAFAALALAQHTDWRDRLRTEYAVHQATPGPDTMAFAHEVRRLAPFVPLLAATARRDLRFHGHDIPTGTRVLLDVVGTLRDERSWPNALAFDPVRFLGGQSVDADALVPQGGGEVALGHRCPGEDIALCTIATSSAFLAAASWEVPHQDLRVRPTRMPTRPSSGVRLVVGRSAVTNAMACRGG